MLGNPIQTARVFNNRDVDELIFLDIYASAENRKINFDLVKLVIDECFMPVAIGGGITSLADIENLLKIGADKVVIASKFINDPAFIKSAVSTYGSQCITVAIDVIQVECSYVSINDNALSLKQLITLANSLNVGEVILTSVDHEGEMEGFNNTLYHNYLDGIDSPVVINGGASSPNDFASLTCHDSISGYASSSIYAYTQYTPMDIKRELTKKGINVRIWI